MSTDDFDTHCSQADGVYLKLFLARLEMRLGVLDAMITNGPLLILRRRDEMSPRRGANEAHALLDAYFRVMMPAGHRMLAGIEIFASPAASL